MNQIVNCRHLLIIMENKSFFFFWIGQVAPVCMFIISMAISRLQCVMFAPIWLAQINCVILEHSWQIEIIFCLLTYDFIQNTN